MLVKTNNLLGKKENFFLAVEAPLVPKNLVAFHWEVYRGRKKVHFFLQFIFILLFIFIRFLLFIIYLFSQRQFNLWKSFLVRLFGMNKKVLFMKGELEWKRKKNIIEFFHLFNSLDAFCMLLSLDLTLWLAGTFSFFFSFFSFELRLLVVFR